MSRVNYLCGGIENVVKMFDFIVIVYNLNEFEKGRPEVSRAAVKEGELD